MTSESRVSSSISSCPAHKLPSAQTSVLSDTDNDKYYGEVGMYPRGLGRESSSISSSSLLTKLDYREPLGRNVVWTLFENSVLFH